MSNQNERLIFFLTVFIAGLCSLIYELLISTTSSYFLGDSVKQFSLTIGVYMAAMGLGSYLTKLLSDELLEWFVKIEILLGLVGGASVPLLYFAFEQMSTSEYQFFMLLLTMLIGVLTGFEIPILVRILKTYFPLKTNLAYVLSLDYIGALFATLLFPFLLLPFVGTFRTSIIFGLANIALGIIVYRFFTKKLNISRKRWVEISALGCIVFFALLGTFSGQLLQRWEDSFFASRIVYTQQTPYQNLVLTKNQEDLRLYINRIIQFSSLDEYRYHESLAIIPLNAAPYRKNVLILGGGEGLLAREVLKYDEVEQVTIVDLDGEVFRLGIENQQLAALNEQALTHPKVKTVTDDALNFLKNTNERFDVILADLPDPSSESIARMYSTTFYKLVRSRLSRYGIFATQATSPYHTRRAFWSIVETLEASGFTDVQPFHTYVPSFGEWGFILAAEWKMQPTDFQSTVPLKYLEPQTVQQAFYFEKDITKPENIDPNYLDQPVLLDYFLEDWAKWRKEKEGK